MNPLNRRWNAILVVAALAILTACQGLSTGKSSQNSEPGELGVGSSSVTFGNVQMGTTQTKTNTITNTGGASIVVTQAAVTGNSGYSITGLSLPLTVNAGQSAQFNIVFGPKSTGSATGALNIATSSSSVSVTLSATGVAASALSTSPTSISFGNILVGSTSTVTETLKNTSSSNLTITTASKSGATFSYSGLTLPLTLTPNQTSTFSIKFAPTQVGTGYGTVSLTVSGLADTVDISVNGSGVAPAILTVNPTSLTFSNITVGQTSSQTETIKNTGGTTAHISAVTASGTGYSVSGISTPVTLAAGASTTFTVTFAPSSVGSTFNGSVVIASDASNPTLNIGLTGSSVAVAAGTLSVSPNPVAVGNVTVGSSGTHTGTLSASGGSVKVTAVSVGGTNGSEFTVTGLSLPVTIASGSSVNFTVTFSPTAAGSASGTATFTSNASNSPSATNLTGTGTATASHSVSLSWTASTSSDVTGYNIYRAVFSGSCGSYTKINSSLSASTSYTDSSVSNGTTYCYVTTAVDSSNDESDYSNPVQSAIPAN